MAVRKYKTKQGLRYAVEVFMDGARVAYQGGFKSKLEAHQWESTAKNSHDKPPVLGLTEVITLFLVEREKRVKPNTMSYKRAALRRFIEFCGTTTPFENIDRRTVESFLYSIAHTISPKSANKYRIELSALYAWAMRDGYAPANLARQTETFSTVKVVKYIPPANDVRKVLEAAKEGFERDFLTCLLHTAGRISEVRELAWEDVDFGRRTLRLWTSKRQGGNREARTLAMSSTLYATLLRRSQERTGAETHVFTDNTTGRPYTRTCNRIKWLMRDLCHKAEVPQFGAHCLRHYLATHFNDPHRAQKILGHMNLRTTEIYLHDLGVDREAADVFESITHKITHSQDEKTEKGATVLQ